jgi:hypothetical protein
MYGIKVKEIIPRISEGGGNNIIEYIEKDEVAFILNVMERKSDNVLSDGFIIRRAAVSKSIPYLTSVAEFLMEFQRKKQLPLFQKRIKNLQEYHRNVNLQNLSVKIH